MLTHIHTHTQIKNMSRKEKSKLKKGIDKMTKFIVSNVIDGLKIKLVERCQFKVNQ